MSALPFDDADLESRLAWIFGSHRSGSTWLLRLLADPLLLDQRSARDPLGFSVPDEAPGAADVLPVNEFHLANHLSPATGPPAEIRPGAYMPTTLDTFLAERGSYLFARSFADVWRPEARRLALVRLNALVERAGERLRVDSPTIVIKEVNGSHAAGLVMSLFPRSRLIFLARDGRDVVDSLLHGYQPGGWLGRAVGRTVEGREQRLKLVGEQARRWTAEMGVVAGAFETRPAELRVKVRYEDLLADTEGGLAGLFAFLGLPRDRERIAATVAAHSFDRLPRGLRGPRRTFRAATPGLWRENLSREELELAEAIMGPTLRRLGY